MVSPYFNSLLSRRHTCTFWCYVTWQRNRKVYVYQVAVLLAVDPRTVGFLTNASNALNNLQMSLVRQIKNKL